MPIGSAIARLMARDRDARRGSCRDSGRRPAGGRTCVCCGPSCIHATRGRGRQATHLQRRAAESVTGGSAASRRSAASIWGSFRGPGRGGGSSRRMSRRPKTGAPVAAPDSPTCCCSGSSRDREGADDLPGPDQAAVDDRPADGGVEGDRAALLPGGRDRHEPGGGGSGADQGGRRRGRRRALVQRHGGQGLRAGAARAPARQRRLPRRALRALLAGQRRGRRRRAGRAGRPHRLRRRPQGPAADRRGVARAGAAGPRRPDHPARALRRHLHRLQPGDVRDRQLLRGDQPAAGGHPRGRRDQGAPGRPRRRTGDRAT